MSINEKALEKLAAMRKQAEINAEGNTDEQALKVSALYPDWEDVAEGATLAAGERYNYQGALYKVLTEHQKQATWSPDTAVSLFTPIPKPEESGTEDNPIAWVEGMESEEGKYYVSDGVKYLCIESSGIGLYGKPADLERYFQIVTE